MRPGCLLLALLCGGCPKVDEPKPKPSVSASSAQSAAAPTRVVASQLTQDGLVVQTGTWAAPGALWGFTDIALDPRRTRLEIARAPHGAQLAQLLPEHGLAVVNGGYFEADYRPSTWLKNAGEELAPKQETRKGGVLALKADTVFIGALAQLGFEPELAVQSFPLIVEADGQAGIHSDDGRRAARTVACLVGGSLHLIVVAAPRGEGPTLFESAQVLREPAPGGFGCRVALNLDGGPSSGVWFSPRVAARQRPPSAPVAYGLAIMPR